MSKNVLLKNLLLILSWKEFELVGSIYGEYPASVRFFLLNLIALILFMSRFHFIAYFSSSKVKLVELNSNSK